MVWMWVSSSFNTAFLFLLLNNKEKTGVSLSCKRTLSLIANAKTLPIAFSLLTLPKLFKTQFLSSESTLSEYSEMRASIKIVSRISASYTKSLRAVGAVMKVGERANSFAKRTVSSSSQNTSVRKTSLQRLSCYSATTLNTAFELSTEL